MIAVKYDEKPYREAIGNGTAPGRIGYQFHLAEAVRNVKSDAIACVIGISSMQSDVRKYKTE